MPVLEVIADGTMLDEVWSKGSHRVDSGFLRGLELAPRSGLVLATPMR